MCDPRGGKELAGRGREGAAGQRGAAAPPAGPRPARPALPTEQSRAEQRSAAQPGRQRRGGAGRAPLGSRGVLRRAGKEAWAGRKYCLWGLRKTST